ncbi:hypothetical protein IFM89_001672 [Coptis chinensis]|uniref:Uncharacterized protein n=1 Tax=Coptis chinensis TaxID=261450 RepID=A0A835LU89_9MAGN|nr:hypothetical protein IFM89_001672 [Coptis chinensis]
MSLHFRSRLCYKYSLHDLSSLVDAFIHLTCYNGTVKRLGPLLRGIFHLKNLHLAVASIREVSVTKADGLGVNGIMLALSVAVDYVGVAQKFKVTKAVGLHISGSDMYNVGGLKRHLIGLWGWRLAFMAV